MERAEARLKHTLKKNAAAIEKADTADSTIAGLLQTLESLQAAHTATCAKLLKIQMATTMQERASSCLRASLPAHLPTCPLAFLPTCLRACLFVLRSLLSHHLFTYLLATHLPTYPLTHLVVPYLHLTCLQDLDEAEERVKQMGDEIDDLKTENSDLTTENEGLRASMGKEPFIGSAWRRRLRLLRARPVDLGFLGGSFLSGGETAPASGARAGRL